MDQLRTFLAAAQRHSFWVMCVVILLVSIGSWWYSTGQLEETRTAQEAKIKQVMQGLNTLKQNNPLHPNDATNQGMDALIGAYIQQVADGWQRQYDRQSEVLVWSDKFGDDFRAEVNEYRPIEKLTYPTPIQDEIPVAYRRLYRNFVEEELPALTEIIGTEWTASSAAAGSGSGTGAEGMSYSPQPSMREGYPGSTGPGAVEIVDPNIVAWSQARQQELFNSHFAFAARVDAPTTLEVLYAQEDIWVLNSIMNIIASTNEGAEARHDAAIKEIDFIRLGRNALGFSGQVTPIGTPKVSASAGTGTGTEGMPMEPGRGPMPSTGGYPSSGYPSDGASTGMGTGLAGDPAEGRYVDSQFAPLPAAKLREALASTNPQDAILAVAKRMPVRMRFIMDQRKLNRLLAECGNSKLPLEVRQVRVNRPAGTGSSSSGGGSGYGETGGYGGSGTSVMPLTTGGGGEYGGMPGAGGGARGLIADASIDNNAIPVEIYGVVYIYNPVNKSQLGIPEEPEATAETTSTPVPVTPTAATTPAN